MVKLGLDVIASASHLSREERRAYLQEMQREADAQERREAQEAQRRPPKR